MTAHNHWVGGKGKAAKELPPARDFESVKCVCGNCIFVFSTHYRKNTQMICEACGAIFKASWGTGWPKRSSLSITIETVVRDEK
jgi:hypothetical protein